MVSLGSRRVANGFAAAVVLFTLGLNLYVRAWNMATISALALAAIGTLDAIGTLVLRRLEAQVAWCDAERELTHLEARRAAHHQTTTDRKEAATHAPT